jgi:glycosyltransferase involved in cell wall biosynthesis
MHASFDEMIEAGISGQLVPQGSVEALATAMIQFWRMPASELDRLGCAARAALERLAPERTFPPLESLYQRVIRQHHDKRCPRHRREAIDWARELARLASNPAVSDDGAGSTSRA